MKNKTCNQCGATFSCGSDTTSGNCWCDRLPPIVSLEETSGCYCPSCLKALIVQKIDLFTKAYKEGKTENLATGLKYKSDSLAENIDFYIEKGCYVFTEWYHLRRGYCCGNGCRHCPYNHINVKRK